MNNNIIIKKNFYINLMYLFMVILYIIIYNRVITRNQLNKITKLNQNKNQKN